MAVFQYKARSLNGAAVSGIVEAYDELEAIEQIKQSCSIVTSITAVKEKKERKDLFGSAKIAEKSLALICSQFSILLTAGLPVVRAVSLIEEQTADHTLKQILHKVAEDVAGGHSLAQSFEHKGAKLLPTTFIETVRAGEESGTLEASFQKLCVYYDRAGKIKGKVRSAMIYPLFLAVLAVCVVAFIMAFVMPSFLSMFDSLGTALPAPTRFLMTMSGFFARNWTVLLLGAAALALLFKLYSATERGRLDLAKLQLALPALGPVNAMKGASQLANTLSTLLSAGLPIIRAVAITARILDNYHYRLRLGSVVGGLEEGRRLGDCLQECSCFPALLVEMAAVGEESGSLEETLETIAAFYDSEVEQATNRALGILQPAITVIMGLVIGFIVIALYLPMFSMYGSM